MACFHVDGRVTVKLDFDFATRLGDFLLQSGTADKQFLALGHKLQNLSLDDEDEEPRQRRDWQTVGSRSEGVQTIPENDVVSIE
jgi:hypothetical protein